MNTHDTARAVDAMTSEELLAGLEGLAPPEATNLTAAERNGLELLSADGSDANIVVNGKLIQGKFTEYMARVLEWKARFESLPESATEEEWDALGAEMRADLERIEPSKKKATPLRSLLVG